MSVQMTGRELDDIVRELYVLPPTDFVAARNELVRQARAAGSRAIAERLQQLRRPTRSAWLVNLLASDSAAMQRLSALGRELRDAQTGLAGAELRSLAEQRRHLINDLMDRARAYAEEADVRLTPAVLSEVEATLQAALVDLAGALTIRNGRLVRPLSHSGFGPRPRVNPPQIASSAELRPVEVTTKPAAEIEAPQVEDELAARRRTVAAGLRAVELIEVTDDAVAMGDDTGLRPELRQAEQELAAAEAAHWTSEFDLADAEAAVEAAEDAVNELDSRRIEARRDKVTAQRHLAEASSRQREAVNRLTEARRRLEAARQLSDIDD
jgi:multidrug resistance efflux pump